MPTHNVVETTSWTLDTQTDIFGLLSPYSRRTTNGQWHKDSFELKFTNNNGHTHMSGLNSISIESTKVVKQQFYGFLKQSRLTKVPTRQYTLFHFRTYDMDILYSKTWQYKMLSYRRDRAAGCVIFFAKSRTLQLGDNDLRTL